MKIFKNFRNRHQTRFITINARKCIACWECIKSCPNEVIGKVDILGHKHIRLRNASACIGCLKCVRTCQHNAITKSIAVM